jgi:hypothetical protein
MTDRAAWWAPANGFQPCSEPRVHLAPRKIHASRRSGKRCRKHPSRPARRAAASDCITIGLRRSAGAGTGRRVGRHVAPGAMLSTRRPVGCRPRRGGRERRWSPSLHRSHFPGSAEGCPLRRHGPGPQNDGEALWGALCLSCGTSPERIAPESLTRSLSDFVHGHISWWTDLLLPNRVTGLTRLPPRGFDSLTRALARRKRVGGRSDPEAAQHPNRDHCVFAAALPGCGLETNCVACMTPSPIGVGTETR